MDKLEKLRAELRSVADRLEELAALDELTNEQSTEFDEKAARADELKAAIDRGERAGAVRQAVDEVPPRRTVAETVETAPDAEGRAGASVTVVRERVEDDPKRGYESFGRFAMDVHRNGQGAARIDALKPLHAAVSGMSQGVGADGGFLVPPEFSQTIWDGMNTDDANLLNMVDRYTVEGESLTFLANDETSRAAGSRWGGVRAYWLAEAAQMTSSKPKLREVKLEPHELAVFVYVTDKLLRNSPIPLQQRLTTVATREISFSVSDAIINGTGAGQPKGILTANLISVAKETDQTAATIVAENILKMYARLHVGSQRSAVWFINQDCWPQLQQMYVPAGTEGTSVYLPPGGLSGSPYGTLMGRPVVPIEFCQTCGTKGDIILADMKGYLAGTRGGIRSDMSIHLRFDYNESAFRFLFEADGTPWINTALTPYKGTNTVAPFVLLAARS